MPKLLLTLLAALSLSAVAQTSFQLPSTSQQNGSDRISSNGFECSNSLASQKTLEVGTVVQQNAFPSTSYTQGNPYPSMSYGTPTSTGGIYARIVIPIGYVAPRVDCTRLYEIELERRQLELDLLKRNAAAPQDTDFKR